MRRLAVGCALALAAFPAAGEEPVRIGSPEEGMARLEKTKAFIAEHGIQEAMKRIQSDRPPFEAPYPAIAILERREGRHFIGAHTTYPSIQGLDFTDEKDLKGRPYIRNFFDKVKTGGGTATTTHAIPPEGTKHISQCYSEWVPDHEGRYWLVVCYDHPTLWDDEKAS